MVTASFKKHLATSRSILGMVSSDADLPGPAAARHPFENIEPFSSFAALTGRFVNGHPATRKGRS
jgi:hypothetical protein